MTVPAMDLVQAKAAIAALSPNGRWYCGTRGSYKAAAALGMRRSDLTTVLSILWNVVAALTSIQVHGNVGCYLSIVQTLESTLADPRFAVFHLWGELVQAGLVT